MERMTMRRWILTVLSLVLVGFGAWAAWRITIHPAPPLTQDGSMRMALGEFNAAHHGALSPLKLTGRWDIKKADRLITPMLFQTYTEGGVHKAVLMTQTQMLEDGEPFVSHAQTADLNFYVFKQERGSWRLERHSKKPLEAGSYGEAPSGDLIRIGPDKFGVLIRAGYLNMGNGSMFFSLVPISEPDIKEALSVQTEGDNGGNGTNDPEELKEPGFEPAWSWETQITLHPRPNDDHFVLKAVRSGTHLESDDPGSKIVSNEGVDYYAFQGSTYRKVSLNPSSLGPAVNEPAFSSTK